VVSGFGRKRLWLLVGTIAVVASAIGCGDIYRPVVTSLPPVQPAAQPAKYAIVATCGNNTNTTAPTIDQICATSTVPGLASVVDFSGDSLLVQVNLGNGPRWLGLNSNGSLAYIANTDGTIDSFIISTSTESNNVNISTLLPNIPPSTTPPNALLSTGSYLYVSQPGRSSVAALSEVSGIAPSVVLDIPITNPAAPSAPQNPVNLVGNPTTQRVYSISQGANAGSCPASGSNGTATGIETTTNTISSTLPLGACPIYGVMSQDNRRTFILNEGSGTVTVIDSQQNQIDTNPNLNGGTGTITVGQGPDWADIYNNGAILAVANSISNTLTLINISTDSFGHDTPNFGQIIATVPVGSQPSSVSVLQDGTRAYVANRGDGTVSVVSLINNTVTKTIALPEQPCSAAQPNVLCKVHPVSIAATTGTPTGKVYVVSPDTNVLTILRTDSDTIAENLPLTGNGIQVRVTAP
jgi:YVTN family beta-propeller protein